MLEGVRIAWADVLFDDSEDRVAFKLSGNTLTFTEITTPCTRRGDVLTAHRFTMIE